MNTNKILDRLRAEIEERKKVEGWCGVGKDTADVYYARGFRFACDFALTVIASLQQEQSFEDLEVRKQIEELANDWHHKGFASDEDCPLCMQDLMDILWHFYELGQRKAAEMYDEIEYNRQRA